MLMRRLLFTLLGVSLMALALAGIYLTPLKEGREIVLVMPPFTAEHIATYALENGLISVDLPNLKVEHTFQFNEVMLSLKGDVGFMSTEAFAKAYEAGKPLKIVAAAVVQGREMGNALVFIKANSSIRHPSQLKDVKLGIPSPRGLKSTNLIFIDVMEKLYNTSIDLSSPLLVDKPLPQLPALLDSGEVDAVLVFGDVAAQMNLQRDKYRLLLDVSQGFKEIYGDYPIVVVLVAKTSLLEESPELVRKVVEALNASLNYGAAHLDEALAWAIKKAGGVDVEVALEALRQYEMRLTLTDLDKEVILTVLNLSYEKGLVKTPLGPEVFACLSR